MLTLASKIEPVLRCPLSRFRFTSWGVCTARMLPPSVAVSCRVCTAPSQGILGLSAGITSVLGEDFGVLPCGAHRLNLVTVASAIEGRWKGPLLPACCMTLGVHPRACVARDVHSAFCNTIGVHLSCSLPRLSTGGPAPPSCGVPPPSAGIAGVSVTLQRRVPSGEVMCVMVFGASSIEGLPPLPLSPVSGPVSGGSLGDGRSNPDVCFGLETALRAVNDWRPFKLSCEDLLSWAPSASSSALFGARTFFRDPAPGATAGRFCVFPVMPAGSREDELPSVLSFTPEVLVLFLMTALESPSFCRLYRSSTPRMICSRSGGEYGRGATEVVFVLDLMTNYMRSWGQYILRVGWQSLSIRTYAD